MAMFARNFLWIIVVFFLFSLYNLSESVEKSKYGCVVCKRKSQPSPFQKAKAYKNDLESCFGIQAGINEDKLHHVSAVSSYY